MPRFIISIRELYDRDLQNRWQGIDTGFGVLVASGDADGTTIVLGDVGPEERQAVERDAGDSEGIQLEVIRDGTS